MVGSLTIYVEGQARNGQLKTSSYDRGITHRLRGRTSEERSAENLVVRSWDHSQSAWKDKREETVSSKLRRTIVGSLTSYVERQARNGELKISSYDRGITHKLRGKTSEKRSAQNFVVRSWDHSPSAWKEWSAENFVVRSSQSVWKDERE